jgi:hypothetical protein
VPECQAEFVARHQCQAIVAFWNEAVDVFLEGGPPAPTRIEAWLEANRGRGPGEVVRDALPEPFLGPLEAPSGGVAGVFLALNPGRAHHDFQGRRGIFAREIRSKGAYSAWAASWPYLRDPWVQAKGKSPHHVRRLAFLRKWTDDPELPAEQMVGFELYPWHSTAVTAPLRPDPGIIREFVWAPIQELAAPVFAFGAPWFALLEDGLRLRVVDRLGQGGRPYGTRVISRAVTVFRTDDGVTVIAERHIGGAGPPVPTEMALLRGTGRTLAGLTKIADLERTLIRAARSVWKRAGHRPIHARDLRNPAHVTSRRFLPVPERSGCPTAWRRPGRPEGRCLPCHHHRLART